MQRMTHTHGCYSTLAFLANHCLCPILLHILSSYPTLLHILSLHRSLEGLPAPDEMAAEPAGLKVSLFPHQRHALAWLQWREQQKPSGGILGKFLLSCYIHSNTLLTFFT